jgi:Domain of unknown function (DUF1996)
MSLRMLVLCVVAGLVGSAAADLARSAEKPTPGRLVNFLAHCKVSRVAPDDPIAYPGRPGRSHDHTFFGSISVDAYATLRSLRSADTTCGRKAETAAYWVPTLLHRGQPVSPSKATAYYTLREFSPVRPYPAGLKIIAGKSRAVAPQPIDVVWWNCGAFSGVRRSSGLPRACPVGSSLELHVRFPECWDGRRLDSPDHQAHMTYRDRERCPATHPVLLPELILIVHYPLRSGRAVALSSGGEYSAHADFFNAWDQDALTGIVRRCSQGRPRCARP